MGSLQLLRSGALGVALLVGQPPVLDDVDMSIYRAAFAAVIRPEVERLGSSPPVVYERTITVCTNSRPGPPLPDCVRSELQSFERSDLGQALPFASAIGETTRAALATSFRQRNQRSQSLPYGLLQEAQTAPEPSLADGLRDAQRVSAIRFSLPVRSEDGFALVFASYTCGNLCAYGWLILLTETDGAWRVVDKHLSWIS